MFKSIIESFLKPETASLEVKVLNLELLAYNFHESLNLKPLFIHMKKTIVEDSREKDKEEYLERLNKVAIEVTSKQLLTLEGAGRKADMFMDLEDFETNRDEGKLPQKDFILELDGIKRNFNVVLLEAHPDRGEIKVSLEIRTLNEFAKATERKYAKFGVGYFDFPMIDNTRLTKDQRCAIVLNTLEESYAHITLVYFPGSHASLKEKPYYQEVIEKLRKLSEDKSP